MVEFNFILNVVWFSLVYSGSWKSLIAELDKYIDYIETKKEPQTRRPIFKDKFKYRSYFRYGSSSKIYLIHTPRKAMTNFNGLFVIHDVSFKNLLEIESLLNQVKEVKRFRFCRIEFTWDFFPKISAVKFQKILVKGLYLQRAKVAFQKGHHPRITFYWNSRIHFIFLKVYIRPKDPNSSEREQVRLEITIRKSKTLKGIGLEKPSDFYSFDYSKLSDLISWKKIKTNHIRYSFINFVMKDELYYLLFKYPNSRVVNSILFLRSIIFCRENCQKRFNPKYCVLLKSVHLNHSGLGHLASIQHCHFAKSLSNHMNRFFKKDKFGDYIHPILKQAYDDWLYGPTNKSRIKPLFRPQIALKVKSKPNKKPKKYRKTRKGGHKNVEKVEKIFK